MKMKPIAVKAKEARRLLGVGTTKFYGLLPELETYLEGRNRMVTYHSIEARVERKLTAQAGKKRDTSVATAARQAKRLIEKPWCCLDPTDAELAELDEWLEEERSKEAPEAEALAGGLFDGDGGEYRRLGRPAKADRDSRIVESVRKLLERGTPRLKAVSLASKEFGLRRERVRQILRAAGIRKNGKQI